MNTRDTILDEPTKIKRQRSFKSVFSSSLRPQTSSPSTTSPPRPPSPSSPPPTSQPAALSLIAPQIPPIPLSSRDSLPMHQQVLQRPYTSHHQAIPTEGSRSISNPVPTHGHILREKQSEASRLRALNNGNKLQHADGNSESLPVENFSRPRQPSVKRRKESPSSRGHNAAAAFPQPDQHMYGGSDVSRDRGFSTSSSASATQSPAYPLRPSMSIPDYQTPDSIYTRQRVLTTSGYRPSRGVSRPDSHYSAQRREPLTRSTGLESEGIRASYRSALTTNSSFLGTSETERSSVLTKSSSATSIYGRDEGMSVDDAIGMYETGFTDSGVEDNYDPTRPGTARSYEDEEERASLHREDARADTNASLLLPPPMNVQIRDSTSIFKFGGRETPHSQVDESTHSTLDPIMQPQPLVVSSTEIDRTAFDNTRDRYGFRKKTQYVSLAQYEAWSGPYTEYVTRRRKKWMTLMKDNGLPTDKPTKFPTRSARVKRFIRKGIPPEWRGAAWFHYAGGPAMVAKHEGLYAELCEKAAAGGVPETDDEIIERDLHRTFPDNVRFKPDPLPGEIRDSRRIEPETPILQSLRRVLQAFAIYNPRIGYCQSLNYLAGMLLLFMEEEHSFWMLNIITRIYLPGTHEINLEGASIDLGVLMSAIKDTMPLVWNKIRGELDGSTNISPALRLPPITLFLSPWFMSCFIGNLSIESTLRVWDSFFYEGSKTIFRIALTILKLGEVEIKAVNDPTEVFQVVQCIPRRLLDCNGLMEACFFKRGRGLGISQEAIEKGRMEGRRQYTEERERLAKGHTIVLPSTPVSGLLRKGSVKKGTLFGRRDKKVPVEI